MYADDKNQLFNRSLLFSWGFYYRLNKFKSRLNSQTHINTQRYTQARSVVELEYDKN